LVYEYRMFVVNVKRMIKLEEQKQPASYEELAAFFSQYDYISILKLAFTLKHAFCNGLHCVASFLYLRDYSMKFLVAWYIFAVYASISSRDMRKRCTDVPYPISGLPAANPSKIPSMKSFRGSP